VAFTPQKGENRSDQRRQRSPTKSEKRSAIIGDLVRRDDRDDGSTRVAVALRDRGDARVAESITGRVIGAGSRACPSESETFRGTIGAYSDEVVKRSVLASRPRVV